LGGAGVAISAQYAVSKLYNDPLLRTSISLVASQDGKARSNQKEGSEEEKEEEAKRELSIAVSSALLLALSVGVIQLVIYASLASGIIRGMGLTSASPMWHSALSYLRMRAFGTPAATLWLVTNGIFRGLGDTRTPLVYSLAFTAMNATLDPLFIFTFGFGASGAALGTLLAQYIALVPLVMALNRKVKIDLFGQLKDLKQTLLAYLEAGAYVLFRSLGKVLAYSVCARETALMGSVAAAAYNLTFQLGFATTQICESVAVAVQTLLAREIADDTSRPPVVRQKAVRHLVNGSIVAGGGVATCLSLLTYFKRVSVMQGLTNNPAVQQTALSIFPAVLATQVLKGLAYPVNGISMGGLDWKFTMIAMWIANIVCVGMVKFGGPMTLGKVWWALAAFMGTQVVSGILRVESKTGVWKLLKGENE
jgi:putative MATE family efflux protein